MQKCIIFVLFVLFTVSLCNRADATTIVFDENKGQISVTESFGTKYYFYHPTEWELKKRKQLYRAIFRTEFSTNNIEIEIVTKALEPKIIQKRSLVDGKVEHYILIHFYIMQDWGGVYTNLPCRHINGWEKQGPIPFKDPCSLRMRIEPPPPE